ncbi:MAG: hypothetical protein ACXVB9_10420 [Bdellovibrionota bacterium]
MIRIKLMDGSHLEIPREEAIELFPYRGIFSSPMLKAPLDGIFVHRGKIVPVLGPLPTEAPQGSSEERPWILLMKGCAQVIRGLPEFDESIGGENVLPFAGPQPESPGLLQELDDLLKGA